VDVISCKIVAMWFYWKFQWL